MELGRPARSWSGGALVTEHKLTVPSLQPLEFILSINSKLYKYETDMPTSQQAAFLVTTVRCWRRYMTGPFSPRPVDTARTQPNPQAETSQILP